MDIISITHGFQFNRVRFADGAVVDVRHHARKPGPRCKTPAELEAWKAEEERFVRTLARQSYAAHCREGKELKAIVRGLGNFAERCRRLVDVLKAGASPVNDQWRNSDELTGCGIEDVREDRKVKLTKADQVLAFFDAMEDLANVVCQRTLELYQFLPIVCDLDPEWVVKGSFFGSKLADAAPYYPPGATLPRMEVAYKLDSKSVYICDERQVARAEREKAKREKARAAEAEARRVARNAAARKRRAAAKVKTKAAPTPAKPKADPVIPAAIAERMKTNLNGHASANGVH